MSLFTSSSRNIYFKIIIVILVGMSVSVGLIRLLTEANDATAENIMGRVLQAKEALPQIIAEPDDLVMFYGSSMVRAGFSPRQFDRAMASQGLAVKSFNFGFGGLNPLFQDYLSRRIKDAFQEKDRRLKLALIEFNPFQTTTVRRNRARAAEDSFFTILGTNRELMAIALSDPERGARLFNIRYLRNNISAEMITSQFAQAFREPRRRSSLTEDETIAKRRGELGEEINKRFDQDYPNYVPSQWSYEWQGGGTIPEERSAETLALISEYYETLLTPYRMENARLSRIQTADIIDLHFEEELVESFMAIVKNFQQISDRVEVILLPKNTQWIQCPPEAMARMQNVINRISKETGVVIHNWQELETVTPSMFRDATHLNRYVGAVAFTDHLIDHYVEVLQ